MSQLNQGLLLQENPVVDLVVNQLVPLEQAVEQTVEVRVLRLLIKLQAFGVLEQSLQLFVLWEESVALRQLYLNDGPAFLELGLLHVLDLRGPGEFALEHEGNEVHEGFEVIPAGGEVADLVVVAGELHVEDAHFEGLLRGLRGVFLRLRVQVAAGLAVVHQVEPAVVLPLPQHHVLGAQVVVAEVLEVEVLQHRQHLLRHHHRALQRQLPPTSRHQLGHGRVQLLQD